jgi:hypothetical protein
VLTILRKHASYTYTTIIKTPLPELVFFDLLRIILRIPTALTGKDAMGIKRGYIPLLRRNMGGSGNES